MMNKTELLKEYKKQEDKLCLSQVLDKIEFSEIRQKIEYTDFLDMYQISLVESFLKKIKHNTHIIYGGFENAERKILIIYPEKYNKNMIEKNYKNIFNIIRIELNDYDKGKFTHRNYLEGIVKLGLKREKVGDILVSSDGADIVTFKDFSEILKQELKTLNRFENAEIEINEIDEITKVEINVETINIIVPSLRLDNIVSDLAKTSRSKAVEIISAERVFLNGECVTKQSKNIKIGDSITIRGKGRFNIKEESGTTRSGRSVLVIEKFV